MTIVAVNLLSQKLIYNFEEVGATTIFDRDSEAPEVIYMDNVMPIARGLSSVAFKPQFPGQNLTVANAHSTTVYKFTTISGQVLYLAITTTGVFFTLYTGSMWIASPITFPTPPEVPCTAVNIQGETYLYVHQSRTLYKFDEFEFAFNAISLSGIDFGEVLGIASSGSRLVLYTKNSLYWSSPFDTTDFIPSLATGAGATSILSIKSRILSVIGNLDGFIIYTSQNAVAARSNNDFNFPFTFGEIPGSAGIADQLQAGTQNNMGAQIIWTGQGFQQVSYEQASYVFPELSEPLMRGIIPGYSGGKPFIKFSDKLHNRVSFVGNRYICISYGEDNLSYFTHAAIYDTLLQRWGKLTVRHLQFITYSPVIAGQYQKYFQLNTPSDNPPYPTYGDFTGLYVDVFTQNTPIDIPTPGETLGIVLPNLAIFSVVMEEYSNFIGSYTGLVAEPAKVIIGKLKIKHDIGATLDEIRIGQFYAGTIAVFSHDYTGNINRKNDQYSPHNQQHGVYTGVTIGDSVSLEITGEFKLSQVEVNLASAGKVNLPLADTYLQYSTVLVDSAHVYVNNTAIIDVPDVIINSDVETSS